MSFDELIPELSLWNDGRGIGVEEWLSSAGSFELAIAYASLFWPDVVEHDGCVLRGSVDSEAYKRWKGAVGDDKTEVEKAMNHKHIADICTGQHNRQQLLYLGNRLAEMWRSCLNGKLPSHNIVVIFDCNSPDESEWYVTFFRRR